MKPRNAVAVKRLSGPEKERLRAALAVTQQLEELTRDLLFEADARDNSDVCNRKYVGSRTLQFVRFVTGCEPLSCMCRIEFAGA